MYMFFLSGNVHPLTEHGREEDLRGGTGFLPLVDRNRLPRAGFAAQSHVSLRHGFP